MSDKPWADGRYRLNFDAMERIVACVNALAGVEDPEAFMCSIRAGLAWLGRAESDISVAPTLMFGHLRAAMDAAGGIEEFT